MVWLRRHQHLRMCRTGWRWADYWLFNFECIWMWPNALTLLVPSVIGLITPLYNGSKMGQDDQIKISLNKFWIVDTIYRLFRSEWRCGSSHLSAALHKWIIVRYFTATSWTLLSHLHSLSSVVNPAVVSAQMEPKRSGRLHKSSCSLWAVLVRLVALPPRIH